MYYQLTDNDTGEELGIVKVINVEDELNFDTHITISWDEFHVLNLSDKDNCDVDDFVEWNNENCRVQIERVSLEVL